MDKHTSRKGIDKAVEEDDRDSQIYLEFNKKIYMSLGLIARFNKKLSQHLPKIEDDRDMRTPVVEYLNYRFIRSGLPMGPR